MTPAEALRREQVVRELAWTAPLLTTAELELLLVEARRFARGHSGARLVKSEG